MHQAVYLFYITRNLCVNVAVKGVWLPSSKTKSPNIAQNVTRTLQTRCFDKINQSNK